MSLFEVIVYSVGIFPMLLVIGMIAREWWVFRKNRVKGSSKTNGEPPTPVLPKAELAKSDFDDVAKKKREVELAAEIRSILAKSVTRQGEGEYEFDANKLTAAEYQLLVNYAKSRKEELNSYVEMCNKISEEPEADCSEEMKLIYGNIGLIELAKFVEAFSDKANRW
jgi:hypothetical protein